MVERPNPTIVTGRPARWYDYVGAVVIGILGTIAMLCIAVVLSR